MPSFAPTPAASRETASACVLCIDPRQEDAHWSRHHRGQRGCRAGCGYEDYAPAYCVGYVGCAQYGGSFEDALTSLCANWARIKGDSRLSPHEALVAIRAAWDRVAARRRSAVPATAAVRASEPPARDRPVPVPVPARQAAALPG